MSAIKDTYKDRVSFVRGAVLSANKDKDNPESYDSIYSEDTEKLSPSALNILQDVKTMVVGLDAQRASSDSRRCVDISFSDMIHKTYGFEKNKSGICEGFFRTLGVDTSRNTLSFLMNMPDFNEGYRWLIPELIREFVRTGPRLPALYKNILVAEENISQPKITMPYINPSDAVPTKIGEAETIPTGFLSFGQRDIKLQKIGVGLRFSAEVIRYTSIDLLGVFFGDMGNQMDMAKDVAAIDVLINGDGNSNGAPVIGVEDTDLGIQYFDIMRAIIRMQMIGRTPQSMLANETVGLNTLMLPEFVNRQIYIPGTNTQPFINLRTPVPNNLNMDIHGAFTDQDQLMLIDKFSTLIKFNSAALQLDNARIVEKQLEAVYATETTGFANLWRDGRVIIDATLPYASNPFPDYMDAAAVQAGAGFRSVI